MSLTRNEIRALIGQRILIAERSNGSSIYEAYPTGRIRKAGVSDRFSLEMWYRVVLNTVSTNADFQPYWFKEGVWTFRLPDEPAPTPAPTVSPATSEVLADWERELLEPNASSNLLNWSVRTRMNEQVQTYRLVPRPSLSIADEATGIDFENFMVSQIINDPDPF